MCCLVIHTKGVLTYSIKQPSLDAAGMKFTQVGLVTMPANLSMQPPVSATLPAKWHSRLGPTLHPVCKHERLSSCNHGCDPCIRLCMLCRPLKAQVRNCQLVVDLAGRNAIWGAVAHLFMAFKPLVPTPKPQPPGAPQAQGSPGLQRGSSGLQRGHSGLPSPRTSGGHLHGQGSFSHQGDSSSYTVTKMTQ